MSQHHDLKIAPIHYYRVKAGTKTFEIRVNDRHYQKGDTVSLFYWDEKEASSQTTITYWVSECRPILKHKVGDVYRVTDDVVVFSLLDLEV